MKYKVIFLIIIYLLVFSIDVNAKSYLKINPQFEEYLNLSDEEKSKLEVIPEEYIYEYENNTSILNKYNAKSFIPFNKSDISEERFFDLYDYNDKRFANALTENQSSLGLCWNFAAQGAAESNILLKGVVGLDEAISKCNQDNNSKYCKYKEDYEKNQNYVNKIDDSNVIFSKRYIDYLRSKPIGASAYNNSSIYNPILEGYNPYTGNSMLGAGGNFTDVLNYYSQGIAPLKAQGIWETYKTTHETYSLRDIFSDDVGDYQVLNAFYYPTKPSSLVMFEEWNKELKKLIIENGSVYVTAGVPDSRNGSCFYESNETVTIDGITKKIRLINDVGNCGKTELHAMQIIGWDDDFTFGYCQTNSTSNSGYDKATCEENGYNWTEGTGAWILKNSWGQNSTSLFPYLSYNSRGMSIYGFREIGIKDYDNVYDYKTSITKKTNTYLTIDNNEYIENKYEILKSDSIEYINKLNFYSSITNNKYEIYLSNDGVNYDLVSNYTTDYVGLYTINIDNYKIDGNKIYVRIISQKYGTNNNISYINVFTKEECSLNDTCSDNVYIDTTLGSKVIEVNSNNINLYSKTRNIPSGSIINYKIIDFNDVDVTDNVEINSNYVINNKNIGAITINNKLPDGEYKIVSTYDDQSFENTFYIQDISINLDIPEPLLYTNNKLYLENLDNEIENNIKVNVSLSNSVGLISEEWYSSDENVATINDKGILNIKTSGHSTITYKANMLSGVYQATLDLNIYIPINNKTEFLSKLYSTTGSSGVYYLMNDIDFNGSNFPDISNSNYVFSGILDGRGHTLYNIEKTGKTVGLFNSSRNATIMNLLIKDSIFTGTANVGSIVGNALGGTVIKNVSSSAKVNSTNYAGGIVGRLSNSEIYDSRFTGEINNISSTKFIYSGGISAYAASSIINNCYNTGSIYSNSSNTSSVTDVYAAGIVGSATNTTINNSYNIGNVLAESDINTNIVLMAGIYLPMNNIVSNYVNNAYYLIDSNYNYSNENAKTLEELKNKSTFNNWDFEKIWNIRNNNTPTLKYFDDKIEVENINLILDKDFLITSNTYDFDFEILPINYFDKNDIEIKSSDKSIFEISNNKIITKDKEGKAKIIFSYKNDSFEYEIEVKKIFSVNYNKNWTNSILPVELRFNYPDLTNNDYIKLIYSINNNNYEVDFEKNIKEINQIINITENSKVLINFQKCDIICYDIYNDNLDIDNIDLISPEFNYEVSNITKELSINVNDSDSGLLTTNEYEYGISFSSTIMPTVFNSYNVNYETINILINYNNKYLWVKNIHDNAGNSLCDNIYCVFDMNLAKINYKLTYYDSDQTTILKSEDIIEDDELVINYYPSQHLCQDYYICEFDKWIGYNEHMKVTNNIDLYASYNLKLQNYDLNVSFDKDKIYTNNEYSFNINTNPVPIELITIKSIRSSDETIFTVNDNKIITGNKAGEANLIIETDEKKYNTKVSVISNKIDTKKYTINGDKILIDGLLKKITVSEFISNMTNVQNYKLYYKNNLLDSISYIRTNAVFSDGINTYYLVLYGDINEDGIVSALDYIKIRNHIMKTNIISSPINLKAADLDNNNNITAIDYIKIKNHIMNGD